MGYHKELYIEAHEELIAEFLEANPHASEHEAIETTSEKAMERATDKLADRIDAARMRAKEQGT